MKIIKYFTIVILVFALFSCSSKKSSVIITNEENPPKDILYLKGEMKCSSQIIEVVNNENFIGLEFNKNICEILKNEFDSIDDTIFWYMDWTKQEDKFYPISSFVKIYNDGKLIHDRTLSFKTGPSFVIDEKEFKKSLYFRISEIRPILNMEKVTDTISKVEILLSIKK